MIHERCEVVRQFARPFVFAIDHEFGGMKRVTRQK
jgi:hypothetical protein